eukprot:COSAG01_NODE_676_length_14324_cov_17.420105_19_plen_542_part_00
MSKAFVDACEAGDVAAARRFLAQGGDPNSKDQGFPALYVAAQKGHIEVVQLLLGGGAAVDRPAKNGATPLSVASWNGHVAVVGALLGGGAAVDQPNKNGATSLYIASEKGHVAAVEALLGGGAAVDRPTKDGATPLFVASFKGHVAAVHALLGGGATVDQPMHNGATPLYKASQEGHADVVRHLLVAGANRACAWQGKTPLNIAQQQGHAEVVALLRNPPAAPTPAPAPAPQPAPPPTATAAALTQLAQDFPGVQPEVISTVLAACGGDATQAHAALQQMAPPAPAPAPADLGATPEPEPTAAAEEGEPPPLDAWLAQIGMSRYSAQIKEYGYDQLKTLLVATEDDIAEMTEDADTQMKKPHRRLFLAEWRVLKGAASGAASPGAASPGAGAPTSAAAAAAAAAPLPQLPDKYVAATQQIRLGQSADATKGLKSLLGIADKQVAQFLLKPEQSIIDEFAANGLAQDKGNLQLVLAGMYVDSNGEKKTLEQLLQHPHAVAVSFEATLTPYAISEKLLVPIMTALWVVLCAIRPSWRNTTCSR